MKLLTIAILLLAGGVVQAQTAVDLQRQGKNVDFSGAAETKPSRTGEVLPATCTTGASFVKLSAPAGQNLYLCTSTNIWSLQVGSDASRCGTSAGGAIMTVQAEASPATPCQYRINEGLFSFTAPVVFTITGGSGNGVANAYLAQSGAIILEVATGAGITVISPSGVVAYVAIPSFPSSSLPLAVISINSGAWGLAVDKRANGGGRETITAGLGITSITNGVISIDGTVPQLGANNAWTGANDFSASVSQTLLRANGDPSTGCSAAGDVGRVYVRGDGVPGNNLWLCENNAGVRRWAKLAPVNVQTPQLGHFIPNSVLVDGGFQTLTANTAYYYQVTLPYPMTVRQVTIRINGGGGAGQAAAVGIYDSSCALLAGSNDNVVGLNTAGALVFVLASAQNLAAGVYHFGVASESGAAGFNVSSSSSQNLFLNPGSEARWFTGSSAPSGTGASYALPASCGTKTQSANPSLNYVWLP